MQTERNFFDELKYQFNFGGSTIQLIMVNVAVFIVIQILLVFSNLMSGDGGAFLSRLVDFSFALKSDSFWWQPWTFFTSIFAHYDFFHLLLNLFFLFFAGTAFQQLFGAKRVVYTYIFGGIFGAGIELAGHFLISGAQSQGLYIIGASGAVFSIFAALAFHRPNLKVSFLGLFEFPIIILAIFFIITNFISIGVNDGTAHLAHLGGIVFGMWSVSNLNSSNNVLNVIMRLTDQLIAFFKKMFSPQPKLKVKKGTQASVRNMSDEEYNESAQERQKKIDAILAKIAKSGYESLSKIEKEYLFKQSKK